MSFKREDLAEGVTLCLGDCRDVLPTLGKVDADLIDNRNAVVFDCSHGKSASRQHSAQRRRGFDVGTSARGD